jgi:hypothetical protein
MISLVKMLATNGLVESKPPEARTLNLLIKSYKIASDYIGIEAIL